MPEFNHPQGPQDTVFDVSAERLARVYAKAALDAAGDLGAQQTLVEELEQVRYDVLDREPRVQLLFASGLISAEEKLAMVDRLFGGRVSTTTLNVLKVLARHGRLGMVRDVVVAIRKALDVRLNRLPVELQTAFPLSPELEAEILTALSGVLGADPIISARVNPELIAGFVIRVGDRVFDGSTRTRLEAMRRSMVARATEAIQSSPQRFFSSEA